MQTDDSLKHDVEAGLAADPAVRATTIGVAVDGGVVTITGHIGTFAEKLIIQRAVERVPGVKAVAMEIDVRLAPEHRRSDTDIAQAVQQALRWNTLAPDQVHAVVDKGWVTLRGEVDWDHQRRSIELALRPLMGIVGLSNDITLKPAVTPDDLHARIAAAVLRQTERELQRLKIEVEGGTVTLRGTVHSWHEREAAQGIAWSSPGVRAVRNELRID